MSLAISRPRDVLALAASIALLAGSAGCGEPARGELAALPAALEEAGPVCTPTDAHGKHEAVGFDCAVCHACAGAVAFGLVTFPGGATTAGGTVLQNGSATTCQVGCHAPLGAPSVTVAWNQGPLACGDCHGNVVIATTDTRSSHVVAGASATCAGCHDQSQHTSGVPRILNADGTSTAGTCTTCHAGRGQTLAGATPPVLVGWGDPASGDFHGVRPGTCRFDQLDASGTVIGRVGARPCPPAQPLLPNALRITSYWAPSRPGGPWAWTCKLEPVAPDGTPIAPALTGQPCPGGTYLNPSCPTTPSACYPTTLVTRGFGGTLSPGLVRGGDALACDACHDAHSSANAFLLAATVNGVAIPPGTIDRAGVGAEALCNACHEGERHALCKDCHRAWKIYEGGVEYFDPAAPAVDPEPPGSPCFWCHGHEGLLHWTAPETGNHGSPPFNPGCDHCHGFGQPATEYAAPFMNPQPTATGVTATTATVSWNTNEGATSWVEYGVSTAGWVAGNAALAYQHSVTLTGLAPSTTYVWRVRSSDQFRNVTHTALSTFSTPAADAVPRPDLGTVWAGATVPETTTVGTLLWYPVTAPSGTPVEYEVQLASDPGFTYLVNAQLARTDPTLATGNSGWIAGTPVSDGGYPPRTALSFGVTLTNLPQDDCMSWDPNVYYFRVRARDALGRVSEWSVVGVFGAMAGDPWC